MTWCVVRVFFLSAYGDHIRGVMLKNEKGRCEYRLNCESKTRQKENVLCIHIRHMSHTL